jgi:predicted DsbA family dithiol-disulfide isomerase
VRIEIWSDVVCPWCYVGKRRLETALAAFPHADKVEIIYRSFELDPSAPKGGGQPVADYLGEKYGGGREGGRAMVARVAAIAAEEGLEFNYANSIRANTIDAHRLLHLALAVGGPRLQVELTERLLRANFTDTLPVDDHAVLAEIAVAAGLPADRVAQVLDSEEFLAEVHADVEQARAFGANGVPFFVIDRKLAISGAQPAEIFTRALEQVWSRPGSSESDGAESSGAGS